MIMIPRYLTVLHQANEAAQCLQSMASVICTIPQTYASTFNPKLTGLLECGQNPEATVPKLKLDKI